MQSIQFMYEFSMHAGSIQPLCHSSFICVHFLQIGFGVSVDILWYIVDEIRYGAAVCVVV